MLPLLGGGYCGICALQYKLHRRQRVVVGREVTASLSVKTESTFELLCEAQGAVRRHGGVFASGGDCNGHGKILSMKLRAAFATFLDPSVGSVDSLSKPGILDEVGRGVQCTDSGDEIRM